MHCIVGDAIPFVTPLPILRNRSPKTKVSLSYFLFVTSDSFSLITDFIISVSVDWRV